MREYKFRGKPFEDVDFDEINVHISKNDFVYGNLIVDGGVAYIVNGIVEATDEYLQLEQWIPVRPETVGQFTGHKDEDEVEIYDGDILRYQTEDGTFEGVVEYTLLRETTLGCYTVLSRKDVSDIVDNENDIFKVIGNIHDEVK